MAATLLAKGAEGVEKDVEACIGLFQKAAEAGDVPAMSYLGSETELGFEGPDASGAALA
ncbi:hypothetical protein T484DRAFT_1782369 [Baffinella frigidus]|nr:hypothetical protein T484DRAFT_1782369 [Cryptophyta sp. CCMP2293]